MEVSNSIFLQDPEVEHQNPDKYFSGQLDIAIKVDDNNHLGSNHDRFSIRLDLVDYRDKKSYMKEIICSREQLMEVVRTIESACTKSL